MYPLEILKTTLFLDIETVPEYNTYDGLSEIKQRLWKKKALSINKSLTQDNLEGIADTYFVKGGIFSEFAKIICISVGFLTSDNKLRIKSFFGDDEKELLVNFKDLLDKHYPTTQSYYLCGHNIKEFDVPFICRRMVIHQIQLPELLMISGKKPWQTEHLIDTIELWRFGDIKNYTSLELLATVLGIETPKDDIDGSQVAGVYWNENDLYRIVKYCQRDVVTVVQVMMHYGGIESIEEKNICFIG
jgi:hypothetical protein